MVETILTTNNTKMGGELINMFIRFVFVTALFFINFLALSISLQCNRDKGMFRKIFVGIYAFLFGFIYIFVNFYSYRIMTLGEPCVIDTTELFPL